MNSRTFKLMATAVLALASLSIYWVHYDAVGTLRNLGYETTAIAASILDHGTFANPFPVATGPTAFLAPVYPAWLALLMKLFGTGATGVLAVQWSVTLTIALQMALLPWIAERIGLGFWTGAIASAALLLADLPREDVWEQWLTGLAFLLACDAMVKISNRDASRIRLIFTGIGLGALLLLSPVAVVVYPLWAGWLLIRRTWSIKQAAIVAVAAIAGVSPWLVRNFVVFHHPMYVRDNFGMEMHADFNDCSTYSFDLDQRSGCFARTHPNEGPELALKVRQMGEIEYNRWALREARAWIAANPAKVAKLTRQRVEVYWFPSIAHSSFANVPRRYAMISVATILSVIGLILFWRRHEAAAAVLTWWLLGFPVVYYLVHYLDRYRAPLLWMTFVLAAYAFTEGGRILRTRLR